MKKFIEVVCIMLASYSVVFAGNEAPKPSLDTVVFQVAAKEWVSTETALLTVKINATLNNADLVKARADIMGNLTKIAAGDWHLTQFDRSQDSSGLEKLFVVAEARVPQASLTNIYQNAKSVTKPGASYDIATVEFKPSTLEIQQIKTRLRERLYQQVQDELARINTVYKGQKYSLNHLLFVDGDAGPVAQPKAYRSPEMMNALMSPAPAAPLAVSNELLMTAVVQAASNRQQP